MSNSVFLTGGTGYMGTRLARLLLSRGWRVKALVRPGSEHKLPEGVEPIPGDALDGSTYAKRVDSGDTFVHLVGVAHPGPGKDREFVEIDQWSGLEAIEVAWKAGVRHFVYLSVGQPAPVMKAYVAARQKCEETIRACGLTSTILRPWYVLGPGHRWPYAILPFYWLFEMIPATRSGALRLGLVTIDQMVNALAEAVETQPAGVRVAEVPEIRSMGTRAACENRLTA